MSNDSSSVSDILSKINDERRAEQLEREIRYASRKGIKIKNRQNIEQTAEKLCAAITQALEEERSPSELAILAAALGSAATAMQMAETYAESMPIHGYDGFCACTV